MPIFEGAYQKNDPVYLEKRQYEEPKEYFKLVVSLIESVYNQNAISLIDVGCAAGAFIYYAKKRLNIKECVGMDISDSHLEQAKGHLPDVEFVLDSITAPRYVVGREFDVCTCLGTMSIFDDIDEVLANLLSLVRKGGSLYIFDLVNEYPIDVVMRHRVVQNNECSEWQPGFNVRSMTTYERLIHGIDRNLELIWVDFDMPIPIPQTSDPMRAWTIKTEHKDNQLVVGTGQMLNFKILQIRNE